VLARAITLLKKTLAADKPTIDGEHALSELSTYLIAAVVNIGVSTATKMPDRKQTEE